MTIRNEHMTEKVQGIVLEKVCQVSADEDMKRAGQTKQVTVRVSFDEVDLADVFQAALRPTIIKWQNAARAKYATLPKTVDVHFSEAGRRDPIQASLAKVATMDKAGKLAYLKQVEALLNEDTDTDEAA